MTLIYHVRPRDQWCDPVDGSEPFVTKADYDALAAELAIQKDANKALLKLVEDWIAQAEQGVLVEHDCPAMYACASIVADADTLTRSVPERACESK